MEKPDGAPTLIVGTELAAKVDMGRVGPARQGLLLCGATKRNGEPCKMQALIGSKRCRMHGGYSRSSQAASTTSGRYARHLPKHLRESVEAALADEDLLSLREEVALFKARLEELCGRLASGESAGLIENMLAAYSAMESALKTGDSEAMTTSFTRLGKLLRTAKSAEETWEAIAETTRHLKGATEAETKRRADLRQNITPEAAVGIVTLIAQVVNRHVADPNTMAKIAREITAILELSEDRGPILLDQEGPE